MPPVPTTPKQQAITAFFKSIDAVPANTAEDTPSQPSATSSKVPSTAISSKKRKADGDDSTQRLSKQVKTGTAKKTATKNNTAGNRGSKAKGTFSVQKNKTKGKAKGKASCGHGGVTPSGNTVDDDTLPPSDDKPLFKLREIIADLLEKAQNDGLNNYVDNGRQYFIRVGTLCSGTDAPVHVMDLFGMLKNGQGNKVFTAINCFGCEIEPFKQGFLMRNSKPQLLFRDARDFAKDGARRA